MDNHVLWFVFHLVAHYMQLHGGKDYTWHTAISIAAVDLNTVIRRHNEAYWAREQGKLGWHETGDYTDNQCVFMSLLRNDQTYKPINVREIQKAHEKYTKGCAG
jgi:hypothetical protein